MREYGRVHTGLWELIFSLSDQAKVLATYLLSSPHSNMIGCFRILTAYIAADLNWTNETATAALNELGQANWLTYDAGVSWVVIHDFLKYNPIENPNQGKAAVRLATSVPRKSTVFPVLVALARENGSRHLEQFVNASGNGLETHCPTVAQPFSNGSETVREQFVNTVSEPFRNQEQEQEQEQEQDKEPETGTGLKAKQSNSEANEAAVMDVLRAIHPSGMAFRITASDLREVRRVLNNNPDWTVGDVQFLIASRFFSNAVETSQSPKHWMTLLADYFAGPLDATGEPIIPDSIQLDDWKSVVLKAVQSGDAEALASARASLERFYVPY